MPNPLPEAERRRFVEEALKMGVPEERIRQDLAAMEGYGKPPIAQPPAIDPASQSPELEGFIQEQRPFLTRTLPRAIAAGGAALATAPFTGGMSLPAAAALEGGAAGLGDLAYQAISGTIRDEPIKPKESLKVGVTTAVGTGATRTAFDILSRLAGVAPQFVRFFRNPKNFGRFTRTMVEPPREAEFALGERIKKSVEEWRSTKTVPRVQKEEMLREATEAGTKIDATPIIKALEDAKLAAPKTPTGDKLNAELTKIQGKFIRIKKTPADPFAGQKPGGPLAGTPERMSRVVRKDLTPQEVDEFLTKELDNRIYKLSGSPKNQALAEALAGARGTVRETLLESLPDKARTATRQVYEELTAREAATKAISPGLVSLETKVRNLFKPGHQAELEALRHVSKETGIDFYGAAFKLAQQRAFSPDERLATKGLDAVMELIRGAMARPAVKALAPIQSLATPAMGGVRAGIFEERRRKKSSQPGPNP